MTIQAIDSTTLDSRGQASTGVRTVSNIRGHVVSASGNEREFGKKLSAEVSHVITIRYMPSMNEKYKLKERFGQKRTFHILGISHDDKREMTKIAAGEDKG